MPKVVKVYGSIAAVAYAAIMGPLMVRYWGPLTPAKPHTALARWCAHHAVVMRGEVIVFIIAFTITMGLWLALLAQWPRRPVT